VLPERVYARAELQDYLAHSRQCKATTEELTDENARRLCKRPRGETASSWVEKAKDSPDYA